MGARKRAAGWSLSTSGSSTKLLPRSLEEEVSSSTTNSFPACTREETPKSRSWLALGLGLGLGLALGLGLGLGLARRHDSHVVTVQRQLRDVRGGGGLGEARK